MKRSRPTAIAIFLLLLVPVHALHAQEVSLQAVTRAPINQTGDTLEVTVRIGDEDNPVPELLGVGFQLAYDSLAFEFVGYERGSLFQPFFEGAAPEAQEVGPRLEAGPSGAFIAYSVSLTAEGAAPMDNVHGEVVRFTVRVKADAQDGAYLFSLSAAARSTTQDPNIPFESLIAAETEVSSTRRVRITQVDPGDTGPIRFPRLDGIRIDFASLDAPAEITVARIEEVPPGTELPANEGNPYQQAARGYWQIDQRGATALIADVCLPITLLRDDLAALSFARLAHRSEASAPWSVLPTRIAPSSSAAEFLCAEVDEFSDIMLAAPASVLNYPATLSMQANRSFGAAANPEDYRLVALAGDVERSIAATVEGPHESTWTAFHDDGTADDFLVKYDGSPTFDFTPGRGFWLISTIPWTVSDDVPSVDLEADGTYSIPLQTGWNIISNPLDRDVAWSAINAENGGTLQTLWRFNGSFEEAAVFTSAQRGEAFYFLNNRDLKALALPYLEGTASVVPPEATGTELTLTTRMQGQRTSATRVGTRPAARRGLDRFDQFAPPDQFEAASIRLKAPAPVVNERMQYLAREYRSGVDAGMSFDLILFSPPNETVRLQAAGTKTFRGQEVVLVDQQSGRTYDLETQPLFTLHPRTETTPLRLLIGPPEYVADQMEAVLPDAVTLRPGYPNPFRGEVTLEYALPEQTDVRLVVYDILGRRVHVLTDGLKAPGTYRVQWDGLNSAGTPVASGLYFVQLKAGAEQRIQNISLVR